MKQSTLEAKVRDSYRMGPVTAFSGREYIRDEWREVPPGSEPAALVHPLLEVREKESGEKIHVTSQDQLDTWQDDETVTAVTDEPEEDPEVKPKAKRARRSRKGEE